MSDRAVIRTHLSACLGLMRPVSMNDNAAAEWVRLAAGALEGYDPVHIEAGCKRAMRECSHHGKILPVVTAECERLAAEARHVAEARRHPEMTKLPRQRPTIEEVESNERWLNSPGETQEKLRVMGLRCGALVKTGNGVRYRMNHESEVR